MIMPHDVNEAGRRRAAGFAILAARIEDEGRRSLAPLSALWLPTAAVSLDHAASAARRGDTEGERLLVGSASARCLRAGRADLAQAIEEASQ
jgi:hypothetical protein